MKKICLTLVGIYLMMLHAFSQFTVKDTSAYKRKPLKIDEINFVTSYYTQDGNHSAVTGGIGTEKVTDFANGLDLTLVGYDGKGRKNSLIAALGVDHHTSASSAFVSKTGASKTGGTRIYPSLNWTIENEKKGTGFGIGGYYSTEYNYQSIGADIDFSKKTKNNGEFTAKLTGYFDQVKLIYPSELIKRDTIRSSNGTPISYTTASGRTISLSSGENSDHEEKQHIPSSPRNTFTSSFSFSQVINSRVQASLMLDLVYQSGYLGLPFHRVFFADGSDHVENLPSQRFKLPIGFRVNYFLGDRIIIRSFYRYYIDNWGLSSHTANIEVPVKITPFFSVSPFYRYYVQTAVNYFAPYQTHRWEDKYYTSNYALSAFSSQFFGAGIRIAPPGGIGGKTFNSLEIRYGHYTQTTDLSSNVVSVAFKFK